MPEHSEAELRAAQVFNRLLAAEPDRERCAALLARSVELPDVPDIGVTLARRLVALGPVDSIEELRDAPGIGPTRFERLVIGLAAIDEERLSALESPNIAAPAAEEPVAAAPEPPPLALPTLAPEALAALASASPDARAAVSQVLPALMPMIQRSVTAGMLPLPGLDIVGRGIYLRSHGPYELKKSLFEQRAFRPKFSRESGEVFGVPEGYGVNEAPPLPHGVALNQVAVETSWERFAQRRSLDVSAAAGAGPFSISATASHGGELRSEEQSSYATRSSFLAMWSVYLEDPTAPTVTLSARELPTPFSTRHRAVYERFFQRHGSHIVKRAWVGGKAELVFAVARSSGLSASEIQAGLSGGALGGEASVNDASRREALLSNSRCTVLGGGGDEGRLAALSSLDEAAYNAWIQTIRSNPQTIELEVCGIWTLLDDPAAARALQQAWLASATFTSISSVFRVNDRVTFTRGRLFFTHDLDTGEVTAPRPLTERWPELDAIQFDVVDAAFTSADRQLYLFRQRRVVRIDLQTDSVAAGYPRLIAEEFPGLHFARVDAALTVDGEHLYLFSGGQYARINLSTWRVDEGYPDSLQGRWRGVGFDRIDAAFYRGGGKVFFIRDAQHVRYDMVTMRADPGYPKPIVGDYVDDWRFFE